MKTLTVIILAAAAALFLGFTVMFGSILPLALICLALCAVCSIAACRLLEQWRHDSRPLGRYYDICNFE